jgi:type I restriction enzyme S subunit
LHYEYARKCQPILNDILMVKSGNTTGAIAMVETDEVFSIWSPLALIRLNFKKVDARFAYHFLTSSVFQDDVLLSCSYGTQPNIGMGVIENLHIAFPPLAEQRAIANYLDRETARLDALVAAKERLLELLVEKRRAIITRAVTRGLDARAPMKDSGIEWLGEIPAHWKAERARWLFQERDERSETGEEELLTVSHITGVTPRSEKDVNMFEAATTEGYKKCFGGDLVINTLWAWMGAMGVSPVNGIVSPAYNIYVPCQRLEPSYVDAIVRIPVFAEEATRYSKGVWSSRLRLYPEGFFKIWLPVPPLEEQRAIVSYITTETTKIDALRKATERTIALLRERRAALIAATVTGQIDVGESLRQSEIAMG